MDQVSHEDEELTGKRDAARNNSGQPVDHSGPDLGVEPTNSETSGRNPEACPPCIRSIDNAGAGDTDGSDGSRREALDSSQGKSGWGAGGEAPRASARAELRSEAEQRTALDAKEINRYESLPADSQNISALITFFKLLDRWDREGKYKC